MLISCSAEFGPDKEQRKGTHNAATFLHSSVIPPGPALWRATFGYEYNGTQHNRGASVMVVAV
jgi:hypothetical protein